MHFKDIVNIKESYCCDNCSSFEYDLPCKIDKILMEKVSNFLGNDKEIHWEDLSNDVSVKLQSGDVTIEMSGNSRYIKLCISEDSMIKEDLDLILLSWIEIQLNIKIEK